MIKETEIKTNERTNKQTDKLLDKKTPNTNGHRNKQEQIDMHLKTMSKQCPNQKKNDFKCL